MNIKSKLKLLFKSIFTQFGAIMSDEGIQILWNEDGELAEGMEVFVEQESEEGEIEYAPVPDGEYHYEKKVIVIADGKVSEIREVEEEKPAEPEAQPEAEQMEEAPAAPEAQPEAEPETKPEDISITDPVFDAEKEFAKLRDEFAELKGEFEQLKGMVAKLLEAPAEEDAFSASKKADEKEHKSFIVKANNN